jgi:hypothetical protein
MSVEAPQRSIQIQVLYTACHAKRPQTNPSICPPLVTQRLPPLQLPSLQRSPPLARVDPRQKPGAPLTDPVRRIKRISRTVPHLQRLQHRRRRDLGNDRVGSAQHRGGRRNDTGGSGTENRGPAGEEGGEGAVTDQRGVPGRRRNGGLPSGRDGGTQGPEGAEGEHCVLLLAAGGGGGGSRLRCGFRGSWRRRQGSVAV